MDGWHVMLFLFGAIGWLLFVIERGEHVETLRRWEKSIDNLQAAVASLINTMEGR